MAHSLVVLGVNAYHADSAAALMVDGEVVGAAEEERFRRIKHWAGFPSEAIAWNLGNAGLTLSDVTHVAVNTDPAGARWRRLVWAALHPPSLALVRDRLKARSKRLSVLQTLEQHFPGERVKADVVPVAHHLAHLASAFYASPFDEALAVSVDGFGDFASAAWGVGRDHSLSLDGQVHFPHSLGVFYQAITQYLGFPNYGDEYKVMGLAPYGEPRYLEAIRCVARDDARGFALDLRYFRHHRERIAYDWDDGVPTFGALYSPELVRLLGPARTADEPLEQRHRDIARSVQTVFEERYLGLLNRLAKRYDLRRVALAGGCAQNSVANGKVSASTPFADVYVAAAGYDAGGALGAAMHLTNTLGAKRSKPLGHAQLGPQFDAAQIAAVVEAQASALAHAGIKVELLADSDIDERVVDSMIHGGVVGWFQGRMEWGPRALGNRSILADPRRADMKDILNRKIKRRESFRPFAPSVLREHVADWFIQDADVPFMAMVFPIRPEKREQIPAVTHVDGSGRLQTVSVDSSARYHQLISAFHRRTGVPMVLNTSFNENEPIVCRPEQALDCFLRTRMDLLVMGGTLLTRPAGAVTTESEVAT